VSPIGGLCGSLTIEAIVGRRPLTLEKKLPIFNTFLKSGRSIVDTAYDKIGAGHSRHPV
jgi:hypothetical protein